MRTEIRLNYVENASSCLEGNKLVTKDRYKLMLFIKIIGFVKFIGDGNTLYVQKQIF
jgi:hypothetical protein